MAAKKQTKTTKKESTKVEKTEKTEKNEFHSRSRAISYKNHEYLARFMNDRAKVFSKKQTGLPAKMQRKLAREVKRARHLGLLPVKSSI